MKIVPKESEQALKPAETHAIEVKETKRQLTHEKTIYKSQTKMRDEIDMKPTNKPK